jgi:uncharacterized protein (TIGR00297 family)
MNETIMQSWWFIALGYLAFFAFTVGIMLLGAWVEKVTKLDKIICRKLTHIASAFVWVICWFFFGCSVHWIILNGFGTVALYVVSVSGKMSVYERVDAKKSYGLFYFGLVTFIVACVCFFVHEFVGKDIGNDMYYMAGIAYYCLAFGDGFAPVVSKLFKNCNLKITESRSLVGSLTVLIVSLLSVWGFTSIFSIEMDFLTMLSVASITCIAEFYGIKGIDNILIDLAVFGYLVLCYFGLVGPVLEVVIVISPLLTFLLFASKSLTFSGGLTTLILFYLLGYFSVDNSAPIVFVSVMFAVASIVAIVSKKIKEKRSGEREKVKHARDGYQVVAVGLVATVSLIVYYYTALPIFNLLYYVCITEQFADSVASDIGCLTKGRNINIIGFKPIEKGLSGGVSALGTALAFVSSFALMLIPFALRIINMSVWCYALASIIAFIGALMDSVLGSLFQALYQCEKCGAKIETDTHCDEKAKLIKGFPKIKNVTVNFLTSLFTFALGFALVLAL